MTAHRATSVRTGSPPGRRGMAIVVIVVVVATLGLAVLGSVSPATQEAEIAALRVQTTRAFFAAESGVHILIGSTKAGLDAPGSGDSAAWAHQSVEFETAGDTGAVLVGRSGNAERRLGIQFD